jgi:outer membrane protein TolC
MTNAATALLLLVLLLPASVAAQESLTLVDAMERARHAESRVRVADQEALAADARVREARAGLLPRVDLSERWQRGNLPVFAFSALLSQRRFSAADFDVARLNNPDPIDHFRSGLSVEQAVFDPVTRAAVEAAGRGRDQADAGRDRARQAAALDTVEVYGRILLLEALTRAADGAVVAAEADLRRATDRRDAGVVTNADVLLMAAELSAVRQRRVETATEADIARARLNLLMGVPLDTIFTLGPLATAVPETAAAPLPDEGPLLARRPDVRFAEAAVRVADAQISAARAAFLPAVVASGMTEWNGGTFGSRAHGWMAGLDVRLNLFRGGADRARLAAARATRQARDLERRAVEDRARLELRATRSRLAAAATRVDLARAAVTAAREGQRITRDRYDSGLADVTALVASGRALLDAEAQAVGADADRGLEYARLQAARGEW